MRRRQFITLLGGAAAWPLAARAQQTAKPATIGVLGALTPAASTQWTTAFLNRLRELGWTEGRNVAVVHRWLEGRTERAGELAAELVRLDVDVIVTHATLPTMAAKQATSTTPIVFAHTLDPVGAGLVASLARPGGNVTGLSLLQADTAAKRIELMREFLPNLRRLAIIANVGNPPAMLEVREVENAARSMGLEAALLEIRRIEEIAPALEAVKGRAEALYVVGDPFFAVNHVRINTLALGARLPTMHSGREFVEAGGLLSYAPNFPALWRRTAEYVDKILRGAKPGDIPVEQPTKFDLIVNLITAKAIGLEVPPTLLARADEVIE